MIRWNLSDMDMRKDMQKYDWEDFIADDIFFHAAKKKDWAYLDNVLFYLKDYPQQKLMAKEVFVFVAALKIRKEDVPEVEINREHEKLRRMIQQNGKQKKKRLFYWIYAIAGIFVLGCILIPFYYQMTMDNKTKIMAHFGEMNVEKGNVQLIIGDSQTLELEHECANIQLLDDGSVCIDSNVVVPLDGGLAKIGNRKKDLSQLIVPQGKRSTLTFHDGTKIWINSGSKILYPKVFSEDKREIYVDGEVFVEAAKEKERPLIVYTSQLDVKVLGTIFNVKAYQSDSVASVVLIEGKVEVSSDANEGIFLSPNQLLEYQHSKMKVRNVDVYRYICWKDGLMQFVAIPLNEVIAQFSKYYGVDILMAPEVSGIKCAGKLDLNNSIMDVLEAIALTTGVRYEQIDDEAFRVYVASD